jgi:parallel beta-helix repeat protein
MALTKPQKPILNLGAVSPLDYGAIGDGVADDTAAVQSALTSGKPVFDFGEKIYKVTSQISVVQPSLIIEGKLRITSTVTSGRAIAISGTAKTGTTLASDVRTASNTIVVTDASNIEVGDVIKIIDSTTTYREWPYQSSSYNFNYGEIQQVIAKSGTTITVGDSLYLGYTASQTVNVIPYTPCEFSIEGLEMDRDTIAANESGGLIGISYCANSIMSNSSFKGNNSSSTIGWNVSYGCLIESCVVNGEYSSGTGYGIQMNGSTSCAVKNSRGSRCRRMVDFSGSHPSHNCGVTGCVVSGVYSDGSGLGSHGTANKSYYIGNTITNSRYGIQCRSPFNLISNNTITNCNFGIVCTNAPGTTIENNFVTLRTDYTTNNPTAGVVDFLVYDYNAADGNVLDLFDDAGGLVVRNNVATARNNIITFGGTPDIDFVDINNNTFYLQNNASGSDVHFINGAANTSANSRLYDNRIIISNGTYTKFDTFKINAEAMNGPIDLSDTTLLNSSVIEVWGGAGSVSAETWTFGIISRDPDGKKIRFTGEVAFTVSGGGAKLRMSGLNSGESGAFTVYKVTIGGSDGAMEVLSDNTNNFYFSDNPAGYNNTIADGTYTMVFDIEFEYRYAT